MTTRVSLALCLAAMTLCGPALSADFSDPTWPCVQRKVDSLSLGLMWPHPVDPETGPADDSMRHDITELAGYLSLRRVDLDSLQPRIDAFSETYEGDVAVLGQLFSTVFDTLSGRRAHIIEGIGDFSLSQIALADKIDAARVEMDVILARTDPDFDAVDALEEQLDWDQVIYTDRQRNISYLCETPTLLERRLFSIAQMLQRSVRDKG